MNDKVLELHSTCGKYNLSISAYHELSVKEQNLYLCTITIKGLYYDRKETIKHGFENCDLADDYSLSLCQAALDKDKLIKLRDNLNPDKPVIAPIELCYQDQSESFVVSISAEYPNTIIETGKFVWVSKYQNSRLNIEVNFKIDPSCIRLAKKSLVFFFCNAV